MTQHHFETPEPVNLYVQIDRGRVDVVAEETTQASVEVTGREAEDVLVEQSGLQINIIGPKRRGGLFGSDSDLVVSVIVPTGSNLESRTGSADLTVQGAIGTCHCKTGSGDIELDHVAGSSQVETGSGDVRIDRIAADLRIKSGSGDVALGRSEGALAVSTGSGDVEIGDSAGPTLVKTGSGDLRIEDAHSDIALSTGSGDLVVESARRGKVTAKGASGDVHVGIPAGIPVWTDITTVSGSISSDLEGAGQPADGADHIELRAKTVSGDIVLKQL